MSIHSGKNVRALGFLFCALSLSVPAVGLNLGCGGSDVRPAMPDVTVNDMSADDLELAPLEDEASSGGDEGDAVEEGSEPEASAGPVTMVVGEPTAIEGATPTLRITAPRNNATIRTGNVSVRVNLANWELASPQGPHVHLILDNEPYIAIRNTGAPIDLNAVVLENLGHELAEGTHVLRMFPSRGHHESVKDAGAFATVTFHYRSATPDFAFDASAPLLTYSRPKACNVAGERVLVDFFVSNTTLAPEGPRVRWTLDGRSGEITRWAPHYIENLSNGSHEIRLELLGADGTPIAGPFNDTSRTFTVADSCS
jgi:hypothetical protein